MKKIIALLLVAALLLGLTACQPASPPEETVSDQEESSSPPEGTSSSEIPDFTTPFPAAEMYTYTEGAQVPAYKVEPGLGNVVNKNQYVRGTDNVGDYYFAVELSPEAMDKIQENGFVVLDSSAYREYYSRYEDNRYNMVPNFITTDSAVHTFHLMYDYVLKDVERSRLSPLVESLSAQMEEASYTQYQQLVGTDFENAARRNLAYFTIGCKLLNKDHPVKEEVADVVAQELALIGAHQGIEPSPLINQGQTFSDPSEYYKVDYSQFTPRGHYTQSPELEDYFRASMWYGQITFRSAYPDEVRSALLMTSALQQEDNLGQWNVIFETINFFVGECDDITPVDYIQSLAGIYGEDMGSLTAVTNEETFEKALELIAQLPPPEVNSVPVFMEELEPDRDKAITGFRFLGQRFTVDASIFQRLMDRETKDRMLPNSLDIPAAFGSEEAYKILQDEFQVGEYPPYEDNLKEVQAYVNSLDSSVWTSNLYWSWLNMLRPLAGNTDREGYPFFMQNSAWTRKELNTFQGSWTELKHDTLLYSKQPMAEMGGGSMEAPPPPDDRGYVEPNPELYGRLARLVKQTQDGLTAADLLTPDAGEALEKLYDVATQLTDISVKELANEELSSDDYEFIRYYGGELEHIWDAAKKDEIAAVEEEQGYFQRENYLLEHPDALVADVATDPNGLVLEEATGFAKIIVTAFPRDGEVVLGTGVVFSHYEFVVPLDSRMTNEDWHTALNQGDIPPLASWKKAYTVS